MMARARMMTEQMARRAGPGGWLTVGDAGRKAESCIHISGVPGVTLKSPGSWREEL